MAGVACAQRRRAREVLCRCLAMANGAFHAVGAMRAGFPLVIDCLVAGGTGIPGGDQPMHHMLGLIQLSMGRLEGNRRKEKNEQDETEHARTETIHGQTPDYGLQVSNPAKTAISDPHHVSPESDLCTGREARTSTRPPESERQRPRAKPRVNPQHPRRVIPSGARLGPRVSGVSGAEGPAFVLHGDNTPRPKTRPRFRQLWPRSHPTSPLMGINERKSLRHVHSH